MQPDRMQAAAERRMPLPEEVVTFQIALIAVQGFTSVNEYRCGPVLECPYGQEKECPA